MGACADPVGGYPFAAFNKVGAMLSAPVLATS
jgi:hypothetical protein